MPYFYTSSGCIELEITLQDAEKGSHSGDCEADVRELAQKPYIKRQLENIEPELLKQELEEYGAWDDNELSDHAFNLIRFLWLACGDVQENAFETLESMKLYDNGGKTIDRYTAVFLSRPERNRDHYEALGFNENPFHPQGFGQHCTAMDGKHLGKLITLDDLPEKARQFVEQNL